MSLKRVLALVLALTMVFSLAMPGTWAFAEEDDGIVAVEDEYNDEGIVEDPVEEEPTVTEETPAEEPAEEIVVDEQPAEEPEEESEEPEEEFDFDELSLEDTERFEKISEGDVASVGSKGYSNIADAVSDANDGLGNITLLANITDPVTINNTGDDAYEINGQFSMDDVTVQAGAVTFSNSSIASLTVSGGDVKVSGVAVGTISVTGGTLTLDGATVSGNVSATNNGTLVATGTDVRGTLTVDQADVTLGDGNQIVSARDSIIYVSGTLSITGGTYGYVTGNNAASVTGGTFTRIEKSMLKEGYYTDPSTGWINGQTWCSGTVVTLDPAPVVYVSKSDVDKVYYSTLAEAINAADGTTATTITLIKDGASTGSDVRTSAPSVEGKNIILDLNGKTLNGAINVKNGGSLTLRNGTLQNTVDNGQGVNVHAMNGSTSFTLAEDAEIVAAYGIILREAAENASSVINVAGKVTGNVWVIGSIKAGENTINVSGEIDNTADDDKADGAALAVQGLATANIQSSAVITGPTGIEVRGGSLNVADGAKITGTGIPTNVTPNNNGTTSNGVGIAISPYNINNINVTINGGEIKGYTALLITQTNQENTKTVEADVKGGTFTATNGGTNAVSVEKIDVGKFISGGTFSSKPDEELLAKNFVPELVDGKFVVHTGSFPYRIAKAGTYTDLTRAGDGYATLAEVLDPKVAFNPDNMLIVLAAVENDKITLPVGSSINVATGTDVTISIEVENDDAQTIDEDTDNEGYTTYTARLKKFDVEVRRQDGTPVFNKTYNYGDKVATPTDGNVRKEPKPTGTHDFDGYTYEAASVEGDELPTWKFESDVLDKDTIKDITDGATVVLTEKWSNKTYTVRLVGNDGVIKDKNNATSTDLPATCNKTLQLPANPFTYTGHHFLGWKLEGNNKTFTDEYSFSTSQINGALKYVEDGVLTLTALWAIDTFTVAYNPNGGTGTMESQTFEYGVEKALTPNTFTPMTGYHFDHWAATNTDAPVATYTDGQKITLTEKNGSTYNLHAVWAPNTYTINFDVNAPEGANVVDGEMDPIIATYDQSYQLVNGFDVEGYTFTGWKTASGNPISHTERVSNLRLTNNGSILLNAQWEINTFNISFDGNGNTNTATIAPMKVDYASATDLPANTFEKTGYHFLGWAPNASATVATYTDKITVPDTHVASDTTLYAVWAPNAYTINFEVNTPTGAENLVVTGRMDSIPATYDVEYNLNNSFVINGYTFTGWKTASGAVISHTKAVKNLRTTDNGAITLKAQWTPAKYTIKLEADGGVYATDTQLYTVEDTIKLDAPTWTENKRVFQGWKVTTADGNWELDEIVPTGTDLTQKYGDAILTAQWTVAEAKMTTKGDNTYYYDTIADAIKARTTAPSSAWYDKDHPIELNADNVTYPLADGETLTIKLGSHTGFTVTPVNVTGTDKSISTTVPEDSYYVLAPVDNGDGTVTYATAHYIGYVKTVVNTYSYTHENNGEWNTVETEGTPAYQLFDTFANAAADALAKDADQKDDMGRVTKETIKTIVLFRKNTVSYKLADGNTILVDRTANKYEMNVVADDGCVLDLSDNGTVRTVRAAKNYSINYNAKVDGVATTTDGITFTQKSYNAFAADFNLTDPTWEGHTFDGWTYGDQTVPDKTYTVDTDGKVDLTLTANFTTSKHTLNLVYSEAPGEQAKDHITENVKFGTAITLPDLENVGYTFKGWKVTAPTGVTVLPTTMPDGDLTITSQGWTIHKANVEFYNDGVSPAVKFDTKRNVSYNTKVSFPTEPTVAGKTFRYWMYDEKEIDPNTFLMPDTTSTIHIYAHYSTDEYAVKFVMFGGESSVTLEGNYTDELKVPTNTDIEGYKFNGWTDANGNTVKPENMPETFGGVTYGEDKTATYTGSWELKTANIGFWNAGKTPNERISIKTNVKYGTEINFPDAPDLTEIGKTFSHWTYNGKQIDHTNFTMPDPGEAPAIRFYAQYTDNDYKITWQNKTSDGTVTVLETDTKLHYGDTVKVLTAPDAEANYSFAGWEYDHELGEGNTMPASDVVATATWKGKNVTTTWLDGETLLWQNYKQEYGAEIVMPSDKTIKAVLERTKAGFALDKDDLWNPAPDTATGDIVFRLKWKQLYTVSFVTEGAASGSYVTIGTYGPVMDGKTVPVGADPIAKDASGKQASWLIDGEPFVFGETPITKDTTLVATWSEEPVDEECADFTYNMSLTDSLNMKYYVRNVKADYDYRNFEVIVTIEDEEPKSFFLDSAEENELPIASLDARRMTDNINVVVKYNGEKIKESNYTIQAYCEALLGSGNAKLDTLVKAVLAYGANAQLALNYKTTELPTDSYDVSGVQLPSVKATRRGQFNDVKNVGDRILVDSTITLDVMIELADGVNPETVKAYVDSNADATALTKAIGNWYAVSIPVSALRLDANHTVMVECENGDVAIYSGSALVPISRAGNDLTKAVYNYFQAAQDYYGSL